MVRTVWELGLCLCAIGLLTAGTVQANPNRSGAPAPVFTPEYQATPPSYPGIAPSYPSSPSPFGLPGVIEGLRNAIQPAVPVNPYAPAPYSYAPSPDPIPTQPYVNGSSAGTDMGFGQPQSGIQWVPRGQANPRSYK